MKQFLLIVLLVFAVTASAQTPVNTPKYSQVRILSLDRSVFDKMADEGLLIDHAIRKGSFIEAWLSSDEIEMLKKSGVPYQITIADWNTYYEQLPKMTSAEMRSAINGTRELNNVSHSIYGTMGGFLKYSEVANKLDSMRMQYPALISAKFSIGTTGQGRSIWTVRVTKNPDAPTGRPEVWYHSLIHAREPESMQHSIYYIYWLLENYNVDPIATYILNNRELYFTPVLNPDGYVYNETTNPSGGGLWRKNRRSNAGGSTGVDLNRNYGTYQFWNSSNNGSSTSGSSDTYRGTSPFSELETQAAMNFINSRNINAVLGSHTYGNYLIKPWSWQDPVPTPDDHKFNEYLADMTKFNNYTTGTPSQTVGYVTRGSSDDWYYNDSSHSGHKIMSMTPETGTTGFWPSQAEIIPLAEGMLFTNQYLALIGGAYIYPNSIALNKSSYAAGEAGTLKVKFKNKGVLSADNVKVECISQAAGLNVIVPYFSYPSMASFQSDSSTFNFNISPAAPQNSAFPMLIRIKQNDSLIVHQEIVNVLTGNGSTILADSAENGFSKWTTNASWGITTAQSYSPTRSFTDSPSGNYGNNASNSMTLAMPALITANSAAILSFRHRYSTEAGYDFCKVEVSSNNGTSWKLLKTYNGSMTTWTLQTFDVSEFTDSASQFKVRFTLTSDGNTIADGWYVDNIKLIAYNEFLGSLSTGLDLTLAQEGFYNEDNNTLNMSDTVQIYLRNISAPYSIVDSSKNIIDSKSLSGNFEFNNIASGNYYIVVRHRNSIETWSKTGGESFTAGGNMGYNFMSAVSQAYEDNEKLIGGQACIYGGDADQNGLVNLEDIILVFNDAGSFAGGYVVSDVNGDMLVNLNDLILVYNNSSAFVAKATP